MPRGMTVTSARFVVPGQTHAISGITSVFRAAFWQRLCNWSAGQPIEMIRGSRHLRVPALHCHNLVNSRKPVYRIRL
jgi:hypothetical protein